MTLVHKWALVPGRPRLRLAQAAYRVDRKGAGNDFEIDPDPEHGFEIFNWQLSSGSIQSVSYA